jgi:metallophosphoesterase (TIGR00282 family)
MSLKVVMIGDIVGKPGRRVTQQQIPAIRERWAPDLIVANGENIAGGSGITAQLHKKLLSYGVDGVTLGDHCFRQRDLIPVIDQTEKLIRPINLPAQSKGQTVLRLDPGIDGAEPLYVITVLGRLFMAGGPLADDPFAACDRFLETYPADGPVIVEAHMEATSEKIALAHHLDGRVAAVLGSHTHVPTADAKVLPGGTAFLTDLGMTGPYDSVLGRKKDRVVKFMSTGMPAPFDVAGDDADVKLCGVYVEIGDDRKAIACERIELDANLSIEPFAG